MPYLSAFPLVVAVGSVLDTSALLPNSVAHRHAQQDDLRALRAQGDRCLRLRKFAMDGGLVKKALSCLHFHHLDPRL